MVFRFRALIRSTHRDNNLANARKLSDGHVERVHSGSNFGPHFVSTVPTCQETARPLWSRIQSLDLLAGQIVDGDFDRTVAGERKGDKHVGVEWIGETVAKLKRVGNHLLFDPDGSRADGLVKRNK